MEGDKCFPDDLSVSEVVPASDILTEGVHHHLHRSPEEIALQKQLAFERLHLSSLSLKAYLAPSGTPPMQTHTVVETFADGHSEVFAVRKC